MAKTFKLQFVTFLVKNEPKSVIKQVVYIKKN